MSTAARKSKRKGQPASGKKKPSKRSKKTKDATPVDKLQAFLDAHAAEIQEFTGTKGDPKIRCTITGHEMARKLDVLEKHWSGKAFHRARIRKQREALTDMSSYEEFFSVHKHDPLKVFCHLTKTPLNRTVAEIEAHMKGKQFQRELETHRHREAKRAERAAMHELAEDARERKLMDASGSEEDEDEDEADVVRDVEQGRLKAAREGMKLGMLEAKAAKAAKNKGGGEFDVVPAPMSESEEDEDDGQEQKQTVPAANGSDGAKKSKKRKRADPVAEAIATMVRKQNSKKKGGRKKKGKKAVAAAEPAAPSEEAPPKKKKRKKKTTQSHA